MDESHPKTRWFRFHLATAVVVMFAAGGLVGLNACLITDKVLKLNLSGQKLRHYFVYFHGWPEPFLGVSDLETQDWSIASIPNLAADATFAALCLGALAALSEATIRRAEIRKFIREKRPFWARPIVALILSINAILLFVGLCALGNYMQHRHTPGVGMTVTFIAIFLAMGAYLMLIVLCKRYVERSEKSKRPSPP